MNVSLPGPRERLQRPQALRKGAVSTTEKSPEDLRFRPPPGDEFRTRWDLTSSQPAGPASLLSAGNSAGLCGSLWWWRTSLAFAHSDEGCAASSFGRTALGANSAMLVVRLMGGRGRFLSNISLAPPPLFLSLSLPSPPAKQRRSWRRRRCM
ncbi:hypothetical protein B296_00011091 [Ensete ventricosum]|uniref:Uncharacterized protein n=1 Tax=Ensete ventricosum TaxID=4639 RepID=A0A427B1G2_ENSVE|nr:hypothetical protein B296_00011091 [Ensete ventricosum]